MDIGILVTIRALLPNLAPVERRVAQAVLDDPGGAARRSISELSRSCGTSATTVVRFCRAVGLRGYPELRLAITAAALRGPGDVAVGLSHTGTTVDTIDALREARRNGAATVAVTNFPWSPITEAAGFVLLTAARETAFRSGAMRSHIAQLTVVDCFFVVLAQRDLPATEAALERTYAAAQAKRTRRARRSGPADGAREPDR